jgi:murein DD-endopeptidase MepM/ murein hydrolase activator NlpD
MLVQLGAQENLKGYYRSPLADDMPITFASNFGELRANRFHAGLDFRVGGVPGAKLYAVADGYVARISVSPEGFGRAVYINHPNGTTSVYGHLHNFSPKIKAYIEDLQYKRQRYAIDEKLPPTVFPLNKGDFIGNAGNSGSSFGAHLHFELRKTDTQMPLNVLSAGIYKFSDNIPPAIKEVIFYRYDEHENEVPIVEPFLISTIAGLQQTVNVPERFFIAIDASDRQNNTTNKFGIYRIEIKLDDKVIFAYRIDEFLFEESRYVNSLMAYDRLQANSQSLIKTYLEPGNKLSSVYEKVEDKGIITLTDDDVHQLSITVWDETGNRADCTFDIQRHSIPSTPQAYLNEQKTVPMYYNRNNRYEQSGMNISIPAGSLYRSIMFTADTAMYAPAYAYSPLWKIHNDEVPLHSTVTLHIQADIPEQYRDKALVVNVTKTGGIKAVGGSWNNDGITAKITSFGDYCVMVDTIPPTITPKFKKGANLKNSASLSVKIYDNLSGINTYKAFIDGQWALMEYDAKNNVLIYTFDQKRIKKNTTHTLLLNVTDNRMNTAGLKTTFFW